MFYFLKKIKFNLIKFKRILASAYIVEYVVLFDVDGLEEARESDGRVAGERRLFDVDVLQVLQSVRVPGTGR